MRLLDSFVFTLFAMGGFSFSMDASGNGDALGASDLYAYVRSIPPEDRSSIENSYIDSLKNFINSEDEIEIYYGAMSAGLLGCKAVDLIPSLEKAGRRFYREVGPEELVDLGANGSAGAAAVSALRGIARSCGS